MARYLAGVFLLMLFATDAGATAQVGVAAPSASFAFPERLQAATRAFAIPGASVAVIHDGQVSLHSTGVRRAGGGDPVSARTVFPIGSTTKAFTATLIGMLVDEGRLRWDDKVRQHLPELRLHDPYMSENITVRDLLGMRSGIANEMMWLASGMSRSEALRRLHHVQPSAGFRERYVYSNINYLLAGQIIERITGRPWAQAMEERIFRPLGMSRTSATHLELEAERDAASSHVMVDGRAQPVPHNDVSAMDAAGSINSTAEDMARWVQFQLTGVAADGTRLLSDQSLREMQQPQMVMSGSSAYGFGWQIMPTYRGKVARVLNHVGSTLGAVSIVAIVPGQRLGIVILANMQELAAVNALLLHALDQHLEAPAADHVVAAMAERHVPTPTPRRALVPAPAPLAAYAGVYESDSLGRLTLFVERGRLMLRRGRWMGRLDHVGDNEFQVTWLEAFTSSFGGSPSVRFPAPSPGRLTLWGSEFRRMAAQD